MIEHQRLDVHTYNKYCYCSSGMTTANKMSSTRGLVPTTLGSKSAKIDLGTNLPDEACEKKVDEELLEESSWSGMTVPSGAMACSWQYIRG